MEPQGTKIVFVGEDPPVKRRCVFLDRDGVINVAALPGTTYTLGLNFASFLG